MKKTDKCSDENEGVKMEFRSKAKKKLRSRAGESIAETLIATLIAALALVMLAGAISSAANMITKSKTLMDKYYEVMNGFGNPQQDGVSVKLTDGDGKVYPFSVKHEVNGWIGNTPVVTYRVTPVTGGGTT